MYSFIEPIEKLIEKFKKLPGVGYKSAVRMAFAIADMDLEELEDFAQTLMDSKNNIHFCKVCGNISDTDVCSVCSSDKRDSSVICVVENVKDVIAFEKINEYFGLYHVLGGLISPSDGIGPEKLNVKSLLKRLDGVKEIIVATTPSVEGEATALYISRLIKPLGITVTRLAYGIPAGSEIEYADELTLTKAIEGRLKL